MSASAPLLGAKPTSRILAIGAVIVRPLGQPRSSAPSSSESSRAGLAGSSRPLMVGKASDHLGPHWAGYEGHSEPRVIIPASPKSITIVQAAQGDRRSKGRIAWTTRTLPISWERPAICGLEPHFSSAHRRS